MSFEGTPKSEQVSSPPTAPQPIPAVNQYSLSEEKGPRVRKCTHDKTGEGKDNEMRAKKRCRDTKERVEVSHGKLVIGSVTKHDREDSSDKADWRSGGNARTHARTHARKRTRSRPRSRSPAASRKRKDRRSPKSRIRSSSLSPSHKASKPRRVCRDEPEHGKPGREDRLAPKKNQSESRRSKRPAEDRHSESRDCHPPRSHDGGSKETKDALHRWRSGWEEKKHHVKPGPSRHKPYSIPARPTTPRTPKHRLSSMDAAELSYYDHKSKLRSGGPHPHNMHNRFDGPGRCEDHHMSRAPMRGRNGTGQFIGPSHFQGPVRFDGPIGHQPPGYGPSESFNNVAPGPGSGPVRPFQQQPPMSFEDPPNQMCPMRFEGPGPIRYDGPIQSGPRFEVPHQGGSHLFESTPGQQGPLRFAPQHNLQNPMGPMAPPIIENTIPPQQISDMAPQRFPEPMNPQFPKGPIAFPVQPNLQQTGNFNKQVGPPFNQRDHFYNPAASAVGMQQPQQPPMSFEGPPKSEEVSTPPTAPQPTPAVNQYSLSEEKGPRVRKRTHDKTGEGKDNEMRAKKRCRHTKERVEVSHGVEPQMSSKGKLVIGSVTKHDREDSSDKADWRSGGNARTHARTHARKRTRSRPRSRSPAASRKRKDRRSPKSRIRSSSLSPSHKASKPRRVCRDEPEHGKPGREDRLAPKKNQSESRRSKRPVKDRHSESRDSHSQRSHNGGNKETKDALHRWRSGWEEKKHIPARPTTPRTPKHRLSSMDAAELSYYDHKSKLRSGRPHPHNMHNRFDGPGRCEDHHMSRAPMRGGGGMGQFIGPSHLQGPVRFDGPIGHQPPGYGPFESFNNVAPGPGPGSGPVRPFQQQLTMSFEGPPNQMGTMRFEGPGPIHYDGPIQSGPRFDVPHQGGSHLFDSTPGQQRFAPQHNLQNPMGPMAPPMYENTTHPKQNFNMAPQRFPEPMHPQFPKGPIAFSVQPNLQQTGKFNQQVAPRFNQRGHFYNPAAPAVGMQQPDERVVTKLDSGKKCFQRSTRFKPSDRDMYDDHMDLHYRQNDARKVAREKIKHGDERVVTKLDSGKKCFQCSTRFFSSESDMYADHLDLHYRHNRAKKYPNKKIKHGDERVVTKLDSGKKCSQCSMRFNTSDRDMYDDHMDLHYRQNDARKVAREKIKHGDERVVTKLDSGKKCFQCSTRFFSSESGVYADHLDLHYRQNHAGKVAKKKQTYHWYSSQTEWVEYVDLTKPEDIPKSQVFLKESKKEELNKQAAAKEKEFQRVTATKNKVGESCEFCKRTFHLYWDDDDEDWFLKNAVKVSDKNFHPECCKEYEIMSLDIIKE